MKGLYPSDNDLQEQDGPEGRDREISLGTTTVLGIFFALALICALFFGFGYTMGRRSVPVSPIASAVDTSTSVGNSSKPSPDGIAPQPKPQALDADGPPDRSSPENSSEAGHNESAAVSARRPDSRPTPAQPAKSLAKPVDLPVSSLSASPGPTVQIAAVSHREDADVLISALQQRGYSARIRQEPQDKLLHIQVGPFATRKEADAVRQRLLADGFNAIVK